MSLRITPDTSLHLEITRLGAAAEREVPRDNQDENAATIKLPTGRGPA